MQPGDTLSQIAVGLGTSVDNLARYNGIADPDVIYVGQALYLPVFEENPVGVSNDATTGGVATQDPSGIPAPENEVIQIPNVSSFDPPVVIESPAETNSLLGRALTTYPPRAPGDSDGDITTAPPLDGPDEGTAPSDGGTMPPPAFKFEGTTAP